MSPSPDEDLDRFREFQRTGDVQVRNELVEQHLNVVEPLVRRYSNRGIATDDLRQVAHLAVLKAVERFDPDVGVKFSTFASRTADGEIKRWFRDRSWSVRPPRSLQELHLQVRRHTEELHQVLGRAPTVPELADATDSTVEQVLEAMEAGATAHAAESLDRPAGDDDSSPAVVLSGDEGGFSRTDERILVAELVGSLGEREQELIRLRFFEHMSQPDIAERFGVSQSYLSRLLRKTLLELREQARRRGLDDLPLDG
jgi:RNA polymerase sigma-B factor